MAGCRLVHALLRRNGEDVWQCVFYLKPENGLLLHRCAFRPEKRRFQKPSFVRLTKCHRTDRSRNESGWKIIVNRRNRPTWQTCKTCSQTSPCWEILSETPIFVCLKGKLYFSAFIDRKKHGRTIYTDYRKSAGADSPAGAQHAETARRRGYHPFHQPLPEGSDRFA